MCIRSLCIVLNKKKQINNAGPDPSSLFPPPCLARDLNFEIIIMGSEAQDAQERVHRAVRGFVGDVDRKFLRPMERETHLCAAECCGDAEGSTERVHACVEKCQTKVQKAQSYMQAEMQRFQVRSMCNMHCRGERLGTSMLGSGVQFLVVIQHNSAPSCRYVVLFVHVQHAQTSNSHSLRVKA